MSPSPPAPGIPVFRSHSGDVLYLIFLYVALTKPGRLRRFR